MTEKNDQISGSDDEVLLQAMRSLWPILSDEGRRQAIEAANQIEGS